MPRSTQEAELIEACRTIARASGDGRNYHFGHFASRFRFECLRTLLHVEDHEVAYVTGPQTAQRYITFCVLRDGLRLSAQAEAGPDEAPTMAPFPGAA